MTTELVELAEAWEAEANQMDDDPDIFACLPHAVRQCAKELRALASRAGGSVMIGKMVEVEFARRQITFKMQGDYHCTAGSYEIRRLPAAPEPLAVGSALAPGCGDGVGS